MTILDRPRTSLSKLLKVKPVRAPKPAVEASPVVVKKVEPAVPVADGGGAGGGRSDEGGEGWIASAVAPATREQEHYMLCEQLVTLWNQWLTHSGESGLRKPMITIDDALALDPGVARTSYEALTRYDRYSDYLGREHYCYCSPSRGQLFIRGY